MASSQGRGHLVKGSGLHPAKRVDQFEELFTITPAELRGLDDEGATATVFWHQTRRLVSTLIIHLICINAPLAEIAKAMLPARCICHAVQRFLCANRAERFCGIVRHNIVVRIAPMVP